MPTSRSPYHSMLSGLLLVVALVSGLPAAVAQDGKTRTLGWDELLPKDWEPAAGFKDMDLKSLSDNDPRAIALLKKLREAWDKAPINAALDGAAVRLPGYVVPLEETREGLKEFLLVPYFGACIHTPPPPANQIVHVRARVPMKALSAMDTVWISGALRATRSDTHMGASGYRMDSAQVERYSQKSR